ncbi:MAG: PDDEXK nuclease domain-containing protein [Treponema sp.]|nr:PDDEXK nuclease domain-containing protein [Treponema sp.]
MKDKKKQEIAINKLDKNSVVRKFPITPAISTTEKRFFADVIKLLQEGRSKTHTAINLVMVETYWNIGKRIVEQEQRGKERANYGDYLIVNLSRHLTDTFGKGFSEANLQNMRRFFMIFPEFPTHCVGNLSWTNIRIIMRIDNTKERNYYLQEAAVENWSSRVLERNIRTGYYRRLISSQAPTPKKKIKPVSPLPRDFVKDPYVLEFLDLPENPIPKETAIESVIINHLQKFLLELGKGFSFVARQQRISTETDHFYADLVFYNYLLKCFVIIDLKTKKLTHQDIGQMDMYVRMFDNLKRGEGDNPTIGIILCTDKSETIVKYSVLKESRQIFASKYMLILPTEEELEAELERNTRYLLEAGGSENYLTEAQRSQRTRKRK